MADIIHVFVQLQKAAANSDGAAASLSAANADAAQLVRNVLLSWPKKIPADNEGIPGETKPQGVQAIYNKPNPPPRLIFFMKQIT